MSRRDRRGPGWCCSCIKRRGAQADQHRPARRGVRRGNSEVIVRGHEGAAERAVRRGARAPGRCCCFPTDDAVRARRAAADGAADDADRPRRHLASGRSGCAPASARALRDLPCVGAAGRAPRRATSSAAEPRPGGLATLEAIARAFALLERRRGQRRDARARVRRRRSSARCGRAARSRRRSWSSACPTASSCTDGTSAGASWSCGPACAPAASCAGSASRWRRRRSSARSAR
jgi:hypothetical protein